MWSVSRAQIETYFLDPSECFLSVRRHVTSIRGNTTTFATLVPFIVKVGQERQAQDGTAKEHLPKDIKRGLSPR